MPHRLIAQNPWLCALTALVSLALSLWALVLDPVINNDGIIYVRAAEAFASGDWREGFSVYKWPAFSMLIAATSTSLGLSVSYSAYLLNAFLFVLVCLGFLALVRSLGADDRTLWWAALIILAFPFLNKFRPFVIRDIGYWAAYLWGLAYFLHYTRSRRPSALIAWALLTVAAFLFRVEALALLFALPLWLWARDLEGRWSLAAKLGCIGLIALLMACFTLWQYASDITTSLDKLVSQPLAYLGESWDIAVREIRFTLDALEREFLHRISGDFAVVVLILTVCLLVLSKTAKALGVVNVGLVIAGVLQRQRLLEPSTRYWLGVVIVVQSLMLIEFAFINQFLADRYPVALALAVLAFVPFVVDWLWKQRELATTPAKWWGLVALGFVLIAGVEGLDVRTQKDYIKEAGLWLREHAGSGQSLYSNNQILVYYSGLDGFRPGATYSWQETMAGVWSEEWKKYDYLAIVVGASEKHREINLLRRLQSAPDRVFEGDGGRALLFSR